MAEHRQPGAKVSERTKQRVVAEIAAGLSQRDIAAKHSMAPATVAKIAKQRAAEIEEVRNRTRLEIEQEQINQAMSMVDFLQSKQGDAQRLITAMMDIPPEVLQAASIRERMGAIKILSECFGRLGEDATKRRALADICDAIREAAKCD